MCTTTSVAEIFNVVGKNVSPILPHFLALVSVLQIHLCSVKVKGSTLTRTNHLSYSVAACGYREQGGEGGGGAFLTTLKQMHNSYMALSKKQFVCVCLCVCMSVYTHTHTHTHLCIFSFQHLNHSPSLVRWCCT